MAEALQIDRRIKQISNRFALAANKFLPQLEELLVTLKKLMDPGNKQNFEYGLLAIPQKTYEILQELFMEASNPAYYPNPGAMIERIRAGKRESFNDFLKDFPVRNDPEKAAFVVHFPFIETLFALHNIRTNHPLHTAEDLFEPLKDIYNTLVRYVVQQKLAKPLQQLVDYINEAIAAHDAGKFNNRNKFILQIAFHIKKYNMPHGDLYNDRDSKSFFAKTPWRDLAAAAEIIAAGGVSRSLAIDFLTDMRAFVPKLQQLIVFEQSLDAAVAPPPEVMQLPSLQPIVQQRHDLMNMEHMIAAITKLTQQQNPDNKTTKLAVLRVLTVIGECSKNISSEFLHAYPVLDLCKKMRNVLLHVERKQKIKKLIYDLLNTDLSDRLMIMLRSELPHIRDNLATLRAWREVNHDLTAAPIPRLRETAMANIEWLHKKTTGYSGLPPVQVTKLVALLPKADYINISVKRDQLAAILTGAASLPEDSKLFVKQFKGLGIGNKELRNIYKRLQGCALLQSIKKDLLSDDVNLTDSNSRLSKFLKARFKPTDSIYLDLIAKLDANATKDDIVAICDALITKSYTFEPSEIAEVLAKVPEEKQDIRKQKQKFIDAITKPQAAIPEREVKELFDLFALDAAGQAQWQAAFAKKQGKPGTKHKDNPKPVSAAELLGHINKLFKGLDNIAALMQPCISRGVRLNSSAFTGDPVLVLACEYSVSLLFEQVKFLNEQINLFKDFSHISNRSIFVRNPLDDLRAELANIIKQRNAISHVKHLYDNSGATEFTRVEQLLGLVMHLISKKASMQTVYCVNPQRSFKHILNRAKLAVENYVKKISGSEALKAARGKKSKAPSLILSGAVGTAGTSTKTVRGGRKITSAAKRGGVRRKKKRPTRRPMS